MLARLRKDGVLVLHVAMPFNSEIRQSESVSLSGEQLELKTKLPRM